MKRFFLYISLLFFLPSFLLADDLKDSMMMQSVRERMVEKQIRKRGIKNPAVLKAMATVPRHYFVPEGLKSQAYADHPVPIGEGQTISQPYIVALMTESLGLKSTDKVLEIGTGSGYQAAILTEVSGQVFTIEIKENLHKKATGLFKILKYDNIQTRFGDGYFGWEEEAPFDCIMITAAVDHIPPPLLSQLKDGGKLILPLGSPFNYQNLVLVTKKDNDYTVRQIIGVIFVPMTGHALDEEDN